MTTLSNLIAATVHAFDDIQPMSAEHRVELAMLVKELVDRARALPSPEPKSRLAFEVWHTTAYPRAHAVKREAFARDGQGQDYLDDAVQAAWASWQASRVSAA